VTLNGAGTVAGTNPITSWVLDYGDGSATLSGSGEPPSSTGHTYAVGTYNPTLTVTDTNGESDVQTATLTSFPAPTVLGQAATSVTSTSATLPAAINPNGLDTHYFAEWGTTTAYGNSSTPVDAGSGTVNVQAAVPVTSLAPATTYHYALVATNAAGTTTGLDRFFMTSGPPGALTGAVTSVTTNSAALSGTATPHLLATTWQFKWGTTTSLGQAAPVPPGQIAGSAGPTTVNVNLSGLSQLTTYYYMLSATNSAGTTNGPIRLFMTTGPPGALTGAATSVTTNSATLSGTATPHLLATTWQFKWGTTTSLGQAAPVPAGQIAGSAGPTTVSVNLSGLSQLTTYYYMLSTTNSAGTTNGPIRSFTTAGAPFVNTGSATNGTGGETLNGKVNPERLATTYHFEYGTTTSYGSTSPSGSAGTGGTAVSVNTLLSGLVAGTTYHYALVATNAAGTTVGADRTFTA
jgi:phosphodiesterase/alkaline phosphatase D-like protein